MATLARPGRPLVPRVQRAYRLEMAGRTVVLLLTLLALTGLVVFYLGVLTGKGLRDPNDAGTAATTAPAATPGLPAVQPTALNEALQAPSGQIEGLAKQERAASDQTQQIISKSRQQLALEDVPDKTAATPSADKPAAPPPAKTPARHPPRVHRSVATAPAVAPQTANTPASASSSTGDGSFTVQVFSSPQQQHAQEILADMKRKGFPAYMNQFQAADKRTWYRVRVGKGTRAEAEALAAKIQGTSANVEPRVLKQ